MPKKTSTKYPGLVMRHLVTGGTLAFVAESVRVLKDVRTRYTNQPTAKVFLELVATGRAIP